MDIGRIFRTFFRRFILIFFSLRFQKQPDIFYRFGMYNFFIQLPLVIKIAFYERNIFYTTFSFVTFLRVFVRIAGGVFGFIRFWIL